MNDERPDNGTTEPLPSPRTPHPQNLDPHPSVADQWSTTAPTDSYAQNPPTNPWPYATDNGNRWTASGSAPTTGYLATAPAEPSRRGAGIGKPLVITALMAGLIGGAVGVGGSALLGHTSAQSVPVLSSSQPANATNTADSKPGSITYAAQVASKSTADIKVSTSQGTAVGSGIVLSPDGYILTNNHVVAGAGNGARIQVTTADGQTRSAEITGTSPSYDLAVIKLDGASGLTPAVLGSSSSLQVGEQVVAVGSPENLSNTVTSGIISALSRTVTAADEQGSSVTVYNGLQTDTPINPGNSGGPLVNLAGQVVAVNSAVDTGQSASGGPQAFGLGFAIPIDTAKRVANQLLQDGQATKPVLGVSGSLSQRSAASDGAQVSSVQSGGAAAKAGIRAGDVITKVGDVNVSNYADLMAQTLTHNAGDTIPVTVSSNGQTRTVQVTLGSTVDKEQTTIPESPSGSAYGSGNPDGSGDSGRSGGGSGFGFPGFGLP